MGSGSGSSVETAGNRAEAAGELIACPVCDALQHERPLSPGTRARCLRCGTVLLDSRAQAMTRVMMLAATSLVLMVVGVSFPFLEISAAGREQPSSLIDAVTAYSSSPILFPLTLLLGALIIGLPTIRFVSVLYTLAPMAIGHRPARHARGAFRLASSLRPWAMAEVFVIGVVVALVKVADLASVTLGPAFWALCSLVVVNVLYDTILCRYSVWRTIDQRSAA